MSAKKIIDHLTHVYKSDDEVVTAHRVLSELYVMKEDFDCKQVRKAIRRLENIIDNKLKQLK